ncbi:MAG: winged helix-turn-helix transcriptional regulator, partial [Candidatus Omnitrophica bacterium]|nr:winged helix-turn-helix transcriptional regulator [Candidatus Omnitrophota bacterium]
MDEREFELINIIGDQLGVNQRDLSRRMELSLGMTNMLIRRLLSKGYIRVRQLNKKKVEYILTPKGFAEKMQKSVRYTMKTIDSIGLVKKSLIALLQGYYADGVRKFYILGSSDLPGLIDMVVREGAVPGAETIRIDDLSQASDDGVTLVCRENVTVPAGSGIRSVNVVEALARDTALVENSLAFEEGVQ